MKKLKYLFLLVYFISAALQANAAIKVSPTVIELKTSGAKNNYLTASIDVQGSKTDTVRFKIYPEYFEISDKGTMDILEKKDSPHSLVKYARFVPNEFTVAGGKTQKVRITIADLKQLPDGESRMVMFFEDVNAKEVVLPYSQKNVTTKLIVKTRVGIPVYVDKGRVVKTANIESLSVENKNKVLVSNIKLTSSGNSKVRYSGKAQIIKDKELVSEYPIKNNVIGSYNTLSSEEAIPTDKIPQDGTYTLKMIVNYKDANGKSKNLIKETVFTLDKKL